MMCKETRPGYCEISVYGWHIVLEQTAKSQGKWIASARPLIEPFDPNEYIVAKYLFEQKPVGLGWCLEQVWDRWKKVFREWQFSPLEKELVQQPILERLRKYDVQSTVRLLEELLFRSWGHELVLMRQKSEVLRKMEHSDIEPLVMFWNIFCYVLPGWSQGPYSYITQGTKNLSNASIEAEANLWAKELVQLPFYPTVNLFAQAINEWLHTCDLRPFARDETQFTGMQGVLMLFEPN